MTTESTPDGNGGIGGLVNWIAALLQHGGNVLTTGDVAMLRRMDPRHPSSAFFKLEGTVLDAELPGEVHAREDRETRWAAVVVGLAHLGELHRPARRLGEAPAQADFSELRFSRLLRADAEQLADEVPMIARYLAAKGVPADFSAAAWLILSVGQTNEERVRRNIARDYYGALARQTND